MANGLDRVSLKDLCLLTVSCYLSPSNVWSIHRLVPYVHCPRVKHIVHSYICDNFMEISHTDQFLALDEKEMEWLLDNQDVKVSEAAMLDSLARWYKHSQGQRENDFKQLFEKLRLSEIGKEVLSEIIKKYNLTKVIPEMRKYIHKKFFPQLVNLDELINKENISKTTVITISREHIEPKFFGLDIHTPRLFDFIPYKTGAIHFWMSTLSANMEIELKPLKKDLLASYVVNVQENLFIFGSAKQTLDDIFHFNPVCVCFDLHTKNLQVCATPPDILPMRGLVVTCGIYIFVFGGKKVIGFDPSPDSQEPLLYEQEPYQTVLRYDYLSDNWKEVAPTLYNHSTTCTNTTELALSYKNRYVYIFGQNSEKYDMYTNEWLPITTPWVGDYIFDCGHVLDGKIFLLGKSTEFVDHGQYILQCFVYHIEEESWQQPWRFDPLLPRCDLTRGLFGKSIAFTSGFTLGSLIDLNHKIIHVISELTFSKRKAGKLICKRKFDFKLHERMLVFDVTVLSRRLQLFIQTK